MLRRLPLAAIIAILAPFLAEVNPVTAAPGLVNYQGKLKRHGTNVHGPIAITFKVFTDATNDACIFEESQDVSVIHGLYSTLIGRNPKFGDLDEVTSTDDCYLEVTVEGQALKPREKFVPPPFARKSTQIWNSFWRDSVNIGWESNSLTVANLASDRIGPALIWSHWDPPGNKAQAALFPPAADKVELTELRYNIALLSMAPTNQLGEVIAEIRTLSSTLKATLAGPVPFDLLTVGTNRWISIPLPKNRPDRILSDSDLLCVRFIASKTNLVPFEATILIQAKVR